MHERRAQIIVDAPQAQFPRNPSVNCDAHSMWSATSVPASRRTSPRLTVAFPGSEASTSSKTSTTRALGRSPPGSSSG